jgi:hypothetical protein
VQADPGRTCQTKCREQLYDLDVRLGSVQLINTASDDVADGIGSFIELCLPQCIPQQVSFADVPAAS